MACTTAANPRSAATLFGQPDWALAGLLGVPLIPEISPEQYDIVLRDLEEVLGLEPGSVNSPEVGPTLGAQYFAAVARRPAEGADRLAAALGERLREVLDPEEFTIAVEGESLSLSAGGGSMGGVVGFALRLPLPSDERLGLALRMWARDVAEFVSETRGAPWPAPLAEVRVWIEPSVARVWWGAPDVAEPLVALRAFDRVELGL
jgi:hypothetical protein